MVWITIDENPKYEISNEGVVRLKRNEHIVSVRGNHAVSYDGNTKIVLNIKRLMVRYHTNRPADLPDEEWKDIEGFEGMYAVSSMGRIKSLSRSMQNSQTTYRSNEKIMPGTESKAGYLIVSLRRGGLASSKYIHRLVGDAFVPNPFNLPEVNHIFGDKKDNRACVLEWNTKRDNMIHAHSTGLNQGRKKVI